MQQYSHNTAKLFINFNKTIIFNNYFEFVWYFSFFRYSLIDSHFLSFYSVFNPLPTFNYFKIPSQSFRAIKITMRIILLSFCSVPGMSTNTILPKGENGRPMVRMKPVNQQPLILKSPRDCYDHHIGYEDIIRLAKDLTV